MSDPNDPNYPYNTPPAPERFQPMTPADSLVRVQETEPFTGRTDTPAQTVPGETYVPYEDRVAGVDAVPALEPLPAMAGDFGAVRTEASEGPTLSSRLVDEFVAWLKTLASAAVYATLIVTFGFQVARVEGQSMAPTLHDQDRLIVNKFVYLTHVGEPQRGDIVMLYYPNNPNKSFVKRVIAAENQTIKIVDGKVFVTVPGQPEEQVDDSFIPQDLRGHDDYGPAVIPEGYYFVMGDHRTNSSDSRHWGYVPKKYIIGRVQLRWWPVPDARTF